MNGITSGMLSNIGMAFLAYNFWFAVSLWSKNWGIFRALENIYVKMIKGQGSPFNPGYNILSVANLRFGLKDKVTYVVTVGDLMDIVKYTIPFLKACNGFCMGLWASSIFFAREAVGIFLNQNLSGSEQVEYEKISAYCAAFAVFLHFVYMLVLHRSRIIDIVIEGINPSASKILILIKLSVSPPREP